MYATTREGGMAGSKRGEAREQRLPVCVCGGEWTKRKGNEEKGLILGVAYVREMCLQLKLTKGSWDGEGESDARTPAASQPSALCGFAFRRGGEGEARLAAICRQGEKLLVEAFLVQLVAPACTNFNLGKTYLESVNCRARISWTAEVAHAQPRK